MLKYRSKMAILTYGSTAIALLVIGYLFGNLNAVHSMSCSEAPCNRTLSAIPVPSYRSSVRNDVPVPNERVVSAESAFETTMRSCLGAFCFDDAVHTQDGKDIVRVGILLPDASEGETIRKLLLTAGLPLNDKIELIHASNVPPYGYGKNHGWSRIIRIARSVVPQTLQLLSQQDQQSLEKLVDPQVRQLLRWHCRLSHVAAHTAMLTVHTDQFLQRPVTELEKMLTFAGHKPNRENLLSALQTHLPTLKRTWDDTAVLQQFHGNCSMRGVSADSILDKAANAVQKEMAETQNLTRWPCRSFRDFKDKSVMEQLPLAVKALAADCGAPHVKCSVRYDTEEYKRVMGG